MNIEFYNKNAVEFFNGTVSADMTITCDKFLKHVILGGKILDAGCGSGRDSIYFMKRGNQVVSFDASEQMVKLSSELTGQNTLLMQFEDIDYQDEFDGVWACASLLHVAKIEIIDVLNKIVRSLKENGILFASFKYGDGEVIRDQRLFNSYNENDLQKMLNDVENLKVIEVWTTQDVRPGRESEKWINCLCIRLS